MISSSKILIALQTTILELDDQKLLYDQGIVKIEKQVLEDLNVVNRAFDDVSNAYQDAIDSDCVSDLFWRVVDFQASGGADPDDYTLECKTKWSWISTHRS